MHLTRKTAVHARTRLWRLTVVVLVMFIVEESLLLVASHVLACM